MKDSMKILVWVDGSEPALEVVRIGHRREVYELFFR